LVLEYACQVFHFSLPSHLSEELEGIQKRALRTIFACASYNSALKEAVSPLFTIGERHSFDLPNGIVLDTNLKLPGQPAAQQQEVQSASVQNGTP